MELTGFFVAPRHAHTAIEILKRSGFDVESANIVTGEPAAEYLRPIVSAERWHKILSSALGCSAVALILAALLLPPNPYHFPWLLVGGFVAISAVLGALAGACIGMTMHRDLVLLAMTVRKDHLNEASHILRLAGGLFVNACTEPIYSTRPASRSAVSD